MSVSPAKGWMMPASSVALSRVRRLVVPAAAMRPPAWRTAFSRAALAASSTALSGCMRWAAVSSAVTGRKVPSPTCRVTVSRAMPAAASRSSRPGVKCSPAVGGRDRARLPREHGLVVGGISGIGLALARDIRRQRHFARRLDRAVERRAREAEGQLRLARLAARDHPGLQIGEYQFVPRLQLAGGPRQHPKPLRPQAAIAAGFRSAPGSRNAAGCRAGGRESPCCH